MAGNFLTHPALAGIKQFAPLHGPQAKDKVRDLLLIDRPAWIDEWAAEDGPAGLAHVRFDLYLQKRGDARTAHACRVSPACFALMRTLLGAGHSAHIAATEQWLYAKLFSDIEHSAAYPLGRLAAQLSEGEIADYVTDDRLDNRPSNLRSRKGKAHTDFADFYAEALAHNIGVGIYGLPTDAPAENFDACFNDYKRLLEELSDRQFEEFAFWPPAPAMR